MKSFLTICFILCATVVCAGEISLKITEKYLILPVSQQAERGSMSFSLITSKKQETAIRSFVIRLSENPEYWVFADVSEYKGRNLKIAYEGDAAGLSKIYQSDKVAGADSLYREKNRPSLHFTSRRGWINDPNGLIYYDGEYHLFYQHNPYEREWENMHWGHAVSPDLLHWQELPSALFPDEHGAMFSGTTVIDYENTSGFGSKDQPAMVAFYTADNPDKEIQCVAYSLDKGRTWVKYAENPVIDSGAKWNSRETRDPKVFWYEKGRHWVMVLFERDGHSIYNSNDLKHWEYQSHTIGFWECPELFELAIDGNPAETLWVMYGASGTYMLGNFDGKTFTPVTSKLAFEFGSIYAAQTFNNIPLEDGRRIQIGWDRVEQPGMPFKGQMSVPTELTLRTTQSGVRLFACPVKEFDNLQDKKVVSAQNLTPEKATELLVPYGNAGALRIKVRLNLPHYEFAVLALNGQNLFDCNLNFNTVNGFFYSPPQVSKEVSVDIIIDKTTVETFLDGGALSYCLQRETVNNQGFRFWSGKGFEVVSLEAWTMKSIWE
jgi:sucrose-6-phosphate hydrolase SacC (GH32 family)